MRCVSIRGLRRVRGREVRSAQRLTRFLLDIQRVPGAVVGDVTPPTLRLTINRVELPAAY
jgi:hypothetical protein